MLEAGGRGFREQETANGALAKACRQALELHALSIFEREGHDNYRPHALPRLCCHPGDVEEL
eukprot:2809316-Prorocentrum_lima.AAC.1